VSADFKALLAGAKLPERTVQICLRGDLVADHEAAERELEVAGRTVGDSLAGSGTGAIVERIEALEAQMREHTYPFRLRAVSKPAFRALVAAYPPRRDAEGNIVPEDRVILCNQDELLPALVRVSVIDPELTAAEWEELLGKITDRQFGDLADAAWFLNRGEIDVPFSVIASRAKRDSAGG
jgi:hypothetical protein